jgi:integrase
VVWEAVNSKMHRNQRTSEQIEQLLAALPEPSKSVATFLVLTGLRIGELLACARLGSPTITWHSLRHCHATLLDAVGAPLGTVQALLGHASSETTRQLYLHAIPVGLVKDSRTAPSGGKRREASYWAQVAGVVQN